MPPDYEERVYAGVLGKIIGVYLGRPVEGWSHQRIIETLGELTYYVNDRTDVALNNHLLVVTDDDIIGTLVFPRALRDHGNSPSSAEVGETWLDQIVEEQTVLWWGGAGNSTEHTAYLNLKSGIAAPESGSIARNGQVVAEQVGAEIFVEGFAMTRPGDPEAAADLAERAARVSHDGEAIHAARVVAALVAGAFVEPDMNRLLDTAVELIPRDCLIRRVIDDVREWSADDWKRTRSRIEDRYGPHLYPGACHIVPNHATVIHALAHTGGDFSEALKVVTTSGWDTDSNAGNVGAICGIRGGLAGIAPRWREPVADRLYLSAADGGAAVTDAAREALTLAGYGRRWAGDEPVVPKDGARFHFTFPASVQGFTGPVHNAGSCLSVPGGNTVSTPTFVRPEDLDMPGSYKLVACPTLYPGQTVAARVQAVQDTDVQLTITTYDETVHSPGIRVRAGDTQDVSFTVPDVGVITSVGVTTSGDLRLDRLTWDGSPDAALDPHPRAWVRTVDRWDAPFSLHGTGLLAQGTRDWHDYTVTADVTPRADAAGIIARYQGLTRYYALEITEDAVQLRRHSTVLATAPFTRRQTHRLALSVEGNHLTGALDGAVVLEAIDDALTCGGAGLTVTAGSTATTQIRVKPVV